MLNRSLFEDVIDAHWVSLHRELAVERLAQHDLHSRLLRAQTQRNFPEVFDSPPPSVKVSNEERKALDRLFGKSGSGSWTGVRWLDQRVNEVKGCWKTESAQRVLLFWEAWVLKLSNEVLHPSAFSIGRLGSPTETQSGGLEWHFGSTPDWLPQALHGAFFIFGQLVGLVIELFSPGDGQELAERMKAGDGAFERAAQWEKTGFIDEPSPAGS
jgi:hypothetical protein